jgi:hypothetical protein
MPRPKLKPTSDQRTLVKQLAAMGASQEHIAHYIGVRSVKTLRKYFRSELDFGAMDADINVRIATYKSAIAGSIPAQRIWLLYVTGRRQSVTSAAPALPPFVVIREPGAPLKEAA